MALLLNSYSPKAPTFGIRSKITIPEGAGFADMVALKGMPTIGDDINKKIIAPLANANQLVSMPDFSNMDAEITALDTKLTKAQQIKQGMMQNLLTGSIRLV